MNCKTSWIVGETSGITGTDSVVKLVDSDVALVAADNITSFIISGNAWSLVLFVAVGTLASLFADAKKSLFVGRIVDDTAFLADEFVVEHE